METGFLRQLFEKGFRIYTKEGISIQELLLNQYGFSPEYVENRLKTVFLNGVPVDALERALLFENSTIAFSGSMPGLAGAILRRESILKGLRSKNPEYRISDIIHLGDNTISVTIRLFNVCQYEMGPLFLKRGIYLEKDLFFSWYKGIDKKNKSSLHINKEGGKIILRLPYSL